MAKSKGFTVEQKMEMRAAYEQGNILKVIAEKWQVSVPTMSKYISSVGGTLRNAGTPKKVQDPGTPVIPAEFVPAPPVVEPEAIVLNANGTVTFPKGLESMHQDPQPEITTPQAPVARRILPFE